MRRKLIKRDTFEEIANSSVLTAEHELTEAENIISKALTKDHLVLHSFTESTVLFKTLEETYVHAGYEIKDDQVAFNNIEELVIDEESQREKRKSVLGEMLDAIIVDDEAKADGAFLNYMKMFSWNEVNKNMFKKKGKKVCKDDKDAPKEDKFELFKKKAKDAGKKVEEAYTTAHNVLDYVKFMKIGPSLKESIVNKDNNGNIVDLKIPSSKLRNENKIQSRNWDTLNSKIKTLREEAFSLVKDQDFCKAVVDLKRQNAYSDNNGLQEVLENIVTNWSNIIYVTQNELAKILGECLKTAGANNYDDQTCQFMAEGILHVAHNAYKDKINQVLHLASASTVAEGVDPYTHFQTTVEEFYPTIDEKFNIQKKVFADLYESFEGLYKTADRRGNEAVKQTSAKFLNELADVLNDEVTPDLELAEEAATWLQSFIETSLEGSEWTVSNKSHTTTSGDHPQMAKNSTVDGIPAKYKGNWGDEAPMIGADSMDYKGKFSKQARTNSWGNEGASKDVYPGLSNPYVPKAFGEFTMKGEKGIDKDAKGQHGATWKSKDTYPSLSNPNVPSAEKPKMNNGKEKDLVVNK